MTGKTSLAFLASQALVDKYTEEKVAVFNLTLLDIREKSWDFEAYLKWKYATDWEYISQELPRQGYTVYLLLDEVQAIYSKEGGPLNGNAHIYWDFVRKVLGDEKSGLKIVMFEAYGLDAACATLSCPVKLSKDRVLLIDQLNFSQDEIMEYVTNGFRAFECLNSLPGALGVFCANLHKLTGGQTGFCATAIDTLNDEWLSRARWGMNYPSADQWIRMLQTGSVHRDKDLALFDALTSTRAVLTLSQPQEILNESQLECFERLVQGEIPAETPATESEKMLAEVSTICLQRGVLAFTEAGRLDFSSPVIQKHYAKMRGGAIHRALFAPRTLPDLIARVVTVINYDNVCQSLGKDLSTGIPLKNAWEMEFYAAAHRCTPDTFETIADVETVFGSEVDLDFVLRDQSDRLWGIKFLREGRGLQECITKFVADNCYTSLGLSDFCLLDFHRVALMDEVPMEYIKGNMSRCEKLFVVCYDGEMKAVKVFNAAMDVIYQFCKHTE
ncbi:hypothetical protein PHYBOEH_009655 [Phytophthora boehmeriae]|uniref:Crinkler (CRN) family protein n=1 Tax=Phytophthora boehmeriae TaxID=109152 RepID=A0A8T1VVK5_9STRA|nr:hypothetical protein PHYBOEH_009655 [Phytophthora boehmeriae]